MQVWPQTYTPIIGAQQVAYMLAQFYSPDALQKQMEEHNHQFILCYSDSEPIAFASYSETEPQIFKLHKLYILPTLQGKGIGRYMIQHIADDLRTRNATTLRLNVNRYNTAAIAFYEKTGFTLFKTEDIDIGNGFFMNDYVLEMKLRY